jgi:hypothetical protein
MSGWKRGVGWHGGINETKVQCASLSSFQIYCNVSIRKSFLRKGLWFVPLCALEAAGKVCSFHYQPAQIWDPEKVFLYFSK